MKESELQMLTTCRKLVTTAQIMLETLREKFHFFPNGLLVPERGHLPWLGIGIEETNAGIGIPACRILFRYQNKKMPDCVSLVQYRTCSGIVTFFQSGTGLTGCRTLWHSGISIYVHGY
jgi:hypothetical protein